MVAHATVSDATIILKIIAKVNKRYSKFLDVFRAFMHFLYKKYNITETKSFIIIYYSVFYINL